MIIYRLITNKKPNNCIACPISVLHVCGKEKSERGSSGSMYITKVPDDRCKIRVGR